MLRCRTGRNCCGAQTPPDCKTIHPTSGTRTPCMTSKEHQPAHLSLEKLVRNPMASVNAPSQYVVELLHDPRGLSTRFLCAANGYLRAERTAKSLPLQAAELWQRSFCPRQRAPGLEPLASKLSTRNTTKVKCYVPSWCEHTQLHSPSVKSSLPVTTDV